MQVTGQRYDTGESVSITISGQRIVAIEPAADEPHLPFLAPGLVDLQVNGYGGQEFNDFELNVDKVARVSLALDADGVTSYLPTATTHSFEMLSNTLRKLHRAAEESTEVACRVVGIHLEGPYISPQDGPHPRQHCRPPDWDEFQRLQEAAGGRVRILTLSPEYEGSAAFIKQVAESGVVVAIGHTAANSEQIRAAADAGARMSTHLGNGAHGQLRRHPNYIWDQLAEDRLVASLIVDGHHLPPSVVKCFVRAKSPDRCVLVSDLVGMAGMPPGHYRNTSVGDIEVLEDGRLVVAGQRQYLAGAGLPITYGLANVMRFAGVDLRTAVEMASQRPAQLMGLQPGQIAIGAAADLVRFRIPDDGGPARIIATIKAGELVFGAL